MNKRLVWNFELSLNEGIDFTMLPEEETDILRWEARYFWPSDSIVTLYGLSESFLDLSTYKIKRRQDIYFLVASKNFNIKKRRTELLYKPLVEQTAASQGFGKKIDLLTHAPEQILMGSPPMSAQQFLLLAKNSPQIEVDKTALIYKLPTTPVIKLELARLTIHEQHYLSVCVEGRSELLVNKISAVLVNQQNSSDYVRFLQETTIP